MGKTFTAWLLLAAAAAAPATSPQEVVQSAVTHVLRVLDDAKLNAPETSPPGRLDLEKTRDKIRRIADELFDFNEMARRTLSRHWAARSTAERSEFVRLYTELLKQSYIVRVESYAGEKIVYVGNTVEGQSAVVRSKILTKRGTDTALDYRLRLTNGRWKVDDVLIDGVSLVANYRSEFNHVIQSSSYAALIAALRKTVQEFRTVERRS